MESTAIPSWTVTPQPGHQINSAALSADGGTCLLGTSEEYGSGEFGVFCYDRYGALQWSDSLGKDAYQGVFWVALSADGVHGAAGGTIGRDTGTTEANGFLRAYDATSGARCLDLRLPSRINQVALSATGDVLVAVQGSQLLVYGKWQGSYHWLGGHSFDDQYCQSCAVSARGDRIVVGTTRNDSSTKGAAGTVTVFALDGHTLTTSMQYQADAGVMRVDMLPDGRWWVASRHDGKAMAFSEDVSRPTAVPAWIYGPDGLDLGVAYAVAVARTESGDIRVVCGANLNGASHGCLYAVKSVRSPAVTSPYVPAPLWQHMLQYDPNPGVSMDLRGSLVTATDGQPEKDGKESAGNFYLFSGDGVLQWRCPTPLMNWPMAVSARGNAAFGASDDGSAYYWPLA